MSSTKVQGHSCSKRGKNQKHKEVLVSKRLFTLGFHSACLYLNSMFLFGEKKKSCIIRGCAKDPGWRFPWAPVASWTLQHSAQGCCYFSGTSAKTTKRRSPGELKSRRIPKRNREVGTDMGWQKFIRKHRDSRGYWVHKTSSLHCTSTVCLCQLL